MHRCFDAHWRTMTLVRNALHCHKCAMVRGNVFQQAIGNLRCIRRDRWLFALNACGASAFIEMITWAAGEKLASFWIAPIAATVLILMAAVYACAVDLPRRKATPLIFV